MKENLALILPAVMTTLLLVLFVFIFVRVYSSSNFAKSVYYERIKTGRWCADVRFGTDKCFNNFEEARISAPTSVLYEEEKDNYSYEKQI